MGYNDYLYQYTPSNLQAAQAGYQSSKSRGNPMADVINTLVAAGVGFMTGGPTGAALGAGQALAGSQNPDVAGFGKAGIGGYEMGLKGKFSEAIQGGKKSDIKQSLEQMAPWDKNIMDRYVESTFPKAYDPNQLMQTMAMLGIKLPNQGAPEPTTKIPDIYAKDLGNAEEYMEGTEALSYGKKFKVVNGQWQVIR